MERSNQCGINGIGYKIELNFFRSVMIITIDGPSSSGKSSAAKLLAETLGYYYYCSGLLYRACAYILKNHADYSKSKLQNPNSSDVALYCNYERLRYGYDLNHGVRILFDGIEITAYLKTPEMDECASIISVVDSVRIEIGIIQRHLAEQQRTIVADGRDMGSVAFPNAAFKFFLTASLEERTRRALADSTRHSAHDKQTAQQEAQAIMTRDQRDTVRANAPLVMPEDAIAIDSTDMTLQQVVDTMMAYIKAKKAA